MTEKQIWDMQYAQDVLFEIMEWERNHIHPYPHPQYIITLLELHHNAWAPKADMSEFYKITEYPCGEIPLDNSRYTGKFYYVDTPEADSTGHSTDHSNPT